MISFRDTYTAVVVGRRVLHDSSRERQRKNKPTRKALKTNIFLLGRPSTFPLFDTRAPTHTHTRVTYI